MCPENFEGRERALYYLSCTLIEAKLNCSLIEKMCLNLMFATQKLRHYMQPHTVCVISKANPIKYILSTTILHRRLAKCVVILEQYDLVHVSQKAIKRKALVDFLADHHMPNDWELNDDLPREEVFFVDVLPPWEMFFDERMVQERELCLFLLRSTFFLIPSSWSIYAPIMWLNIKWSN